MVTWAPWHWGYRGAITALLALVALYLGIAGTRAAAGQAAGGPIYSMRTLAVQLERDARALLDRPVRVRARAGVCDAWTGGTWCRHWAAVLADPGAPSLAGALPLAPGEHGWLAFLRGVPLIGHLVPTPPGTAGGVVRVYRIELHARTCSTSAGQPRYQAVLLDATS